MAARFESVHLADLEAGGRELPPRLAKRSAFFGDLARFGSLAESGATCRTPIVCRKRPGHVPCRGLLVVRRRDLPAVIDWECPICAAAGQIAGWEETHADLRGLELAGRGEAGAHPIPPRAHAVLRDLARTDWALLPLAYGVTVDEDAQPFLRASAGESHEFGPWLVMHMRVAKSRRVADRIVELLFALVQLASDGRDELGATAPAVEQDAEAVEAFYELGAVLGAPLAPARRPKRPRPKRRGAEYRTYRIKVTLRDVKPSVWRRLLVPSDIYLPALHEILQAAMGWYDCHLHAFRVGRRSFAPPGDGYDPIGEDSRAVRLDELAPKKGSRLVYEYDFGDGWCHDILVEEVREERCKQVRCLAGKRRCPPEDCGGPWGYAELRNALADPTHERHAELGEWLGGDLDPEDFDLGETDAVLQGFRF